MTIDIPVNDPPNDHLIATAHHEAAHAVILYRVAGYVGGNVSIVPNYDDGSWGRAFDVLSDQLNPDHMRAGILCRYAGGHAQRRIDPARGDDGCGSDDDSAHALLYEWGWESHEAQLREESRALVDKHWLEIVAVAAELLREQTLDETEVELIADAACGDPLADVATYRERRRARAQA